MDTLAALSETADYAKSIAEMIKEHKIPHRSTMFNHESLGYQHLDYMIRQIQLQVLAGHMSDAKLNRWLGWMQAAICSWSPHVTLEHMKLINRNHANVD